MAAVLEAIFNLELPMEKLVRDSPSVCMETHVDIQHCHWELRLSLQGSGAVLGKLSPSLLSGKQPLRSFCECIFGCGQLCTEKRGWQMLGKGYSRET